MKHSFSKIYHFIDDFKEKDIKYLPTNIALIYRNYEKKSTNLLITKIKNYCKKRKIKFYLANNYKMAVNLNLDGVYLPSFNKQIKFNIFAKRKNFLVIGSAHNTQEIIIKQKQGCKLIFLAPIFKVNKKKHFLGINKFNQLSRNKKISFIALGGINNLNIKKINLLNCYGFAGISWIKKNGLRKLRPFLNCLNLQ
jgi:thiamine-phosphate pyrophosphorylase